jgi:hypothetical protein
MAVLWRETASTMEGKKLWEGGQQRNWSNVGGRRTHRENLKRWEEQQ